MPTVPMFDDPFSKMEFQARSQMGLDDDWRLESSAAAVHVGLEDQIERLQQDDDLDDDERWRELDINQAPLAWLPQGMLLITMKRELDGKVERRSGFVATAES